MLRAIRIDPAGEACGCGEGVVIDRAIDGGAWGTAILAEADSGNAISTRASAAGGQALLGWIQSEAGNNRVKAMLQPLVDAMPR